MISAYQPQNYANLQVTVDKLLKSPGQGPRELSGLNRIDQSLFVATNQQSKLSNVSKTPLLKKSIKKDIDSGATDLCFAPTLNDGQFMASQKSKVQQKEQYVLMFDQMLSGGNAQTPNKTMQAVEPMSAGVKADSTSTTDLSGSDSNKQ